MIATVKSDPSPAPTPLRPGRDGQGRTLQFVTFNIEFHNFLGTRGHHPHLLLVHLGEVGDIADLGERFHSLELVRHVQIGPSFTKIGEGGAGVLVVMRLATFFCKSLDLKLVKLVDENCTDHCSCSSLPSLTMKSHNPNCRMV